MDLRAFELLKSPNQEAIQQATEYFGKLSQDPRFIEHLLKAVTEEQIRKDEFILTQIEIMIVNLIRGKWSTGAPQEQPYWTKEQQEQISLELLNLTMSVSFERRRNLIEVFRVMILKSFPDVMHIMRRVVEYLAERGSSIPDVVTLLTIFYFWAKACGSRLKIQERVQELGDAGFDAIDEFNVSLVEQCKNLSNVVIEAVEKDDNAVTIMRLIAHSLRRLLGYIGVGVLSEAFDTILANCLRALLVRSESETVFKMKRAISKLIQTLNTNYLRDPATVKTSEKSAAILSTFGAKYREKAPEVLSVIVQCMNLPMDYMLAASIIFNFSQFVFFNVETARIVTPEFVQNVLLKYAVVPEDELSELEVNPELYVGTYMDFSATEQNSPRESCAHLLHSLVTVVGLTDQLFGILASPGQSGSDFEARLFLMIVYGKATKALMREKVKQELDKMAAQGMKRKAIKEAKKQLPKPTAQFSQDILKDVVSKVNTMPPHIQVTMIMYMAMTMKTVDPAAGLEMAIALIANGPHPAIVYAASKLFNSCWRVMEESPAIDIRPLLPKLIETASVFSRCNNITSTILALCKGNSAGVTDFAFDLIGLLVGLAEQQLAVEDPANPEMEGATTILELVYNVITELPDKAPVVEAICDEHLPKIMSFLEQFPNNSSFTEIFLVASGIHQKLENPRPAEYASLAATIAATSADTSLFSAAREITWLTYPLITAKTSQLAGNPAMLTQVVNMTKSMLDTNFEDGSYDEAIPYSLFLASCLLQVLKGEVLPIFMPYAIRALSEAGEDPEDNPFVFSSACSVIGAAFVADLQATASFLKPDLVEYLVNHISGETLTTYRELAIGFAILLSLAQLGTMPALVKATACFETLKEYKSITDAGDDESDENEEEDDDNDEIERIRAPFYVPFDDYNAISAYETMFASLPEHVRGEVLAAAAAANE